MAYTVWEGATTVRHYEDWLKAFVDYASYGEAPKRMYFWTGVSALAGALRRRVWIDQAYFRWYPNFYIVLVAPPGVVSKSTTASIGINLLRKVPGINFGPDVVTWQALVTAFAAAGESFEYNSEWHAMSAITLEASEFGNLFNPQDRDMVDLMVSLWDGKQGGFKKVTKMSGNDTIENPWINVIACTTPAWIAGHFPDYLIGGGFTSRCIFIYASEKDRYVAYPILEVPASLKQTEEKLIADLEHIAVRLVGAYALDGPAITWGTKWYEHHYKNRPAELDDDRFGGYIARKQTHIHKLAIVLAASQRDELTITESDLSTANIMVTELEADMPHVFGKIGRSVDSIQAERFIQYVHRKKAVPYMEAYRFIHSYFPDLKSFEDIVKGAIQAGYMTWETRGTTHYLVAQAPASDTSVIES